MYQLLDNDFIFLFKLIYFNYNNLYFLKEEADNE